MAPPPAMTPTGDEIPEAAAVMVAATPSSLAVDRRQTKRAMLALADEVEDLRNRGILGCPWLHRLNPFGEQAGTVEQLLIERADGRQALLGEFPSLHADD